MLGAIGLFRLCFEPEKPQQSRPGISRDLLGVFCCEAVFERPAALEVFRAAMPASTTSFPHKIVWHRALSETAGAGFEVDAADPYLLLSHHFLQYNASRRLKRWVESPESCYCRHSVPCAELCQTPGPRRQYSVVVLTWERWFHRSCVFHTAPLA